MSSTNFIDQTTPIVASWLNDVNTATYTTVPANTSAISTETTNRQNADNTIVSNLSASTGSSLVGQIASGTGATARTVQSKLRESVSVKDFGAVGDGTTDDTASFNAAIASGASHIIVPQGKYKITSTLTINNVNGFIMEGDSAALYATGTTYSTNSVLVFDNASSGTNGLVISNFIGVVLKNLVISQNHSGAGGGNALFLWGGHDFILENIKVDSNTGTSGNGIVLGNSTGVTAAFLGKLQNCKVISNGGAAFVSNASNTSLTFDNCYSINGYYSFIGTTYSSIINCAADGAANYAYNFNNCVSFNSIACGAEAAGKGTFSITNGSNNMTFINPTGVSNNTSAGTGYGDLFNIDSSSGADQSLIINNPISLYPNAATTASIYGTSGTGNVEVYNVLSANFTKGFGGDTTWLLNKLSFTGDGELRTFTSTLGAGWTNVGTPTISSVFNKKGKLVTFNILITPATSISCTVKAQVTIPWSVAYGSAVTAIDGNANGYANGIVGGSTIYMPAVGVITVPLNIVGQFYIA